MPLTVWCVWYNVFYISLSLRLSVCLAGCLIVRMQFHQNVLQVDNFYLNIYNTAAAAPAPAVRALNSHNKIFHITIGASAQQKMSLDQRKKCGIWSNALDWLDNTSVFNTKTFHFILYIAMYVHRSFGMYQIMCVCIDRYVCMQQKQKCSTSRVWSTILYIIQDKQTECHHPPQTYSSSSLSSSYLCTYVCMYVVLFSFVFQIFDVAFAASIERILMDSEKKNSYLFLFAVCFYKVRWSKVEVAIIFNSKQLQKRKTYFIIFILYFIKMQKGKKATATASNRNRCISIEKWHFSYNNLNTISQTATLQVTLCRSQRIPKIPYCGEVKRYLFMHSILSGTIIFGTFKHSIESVRPFHQHVKRCSILLVPWPSKVSQ